MSDADLGHDLATTHADPPADGRGVVCDAGREATKLARTVVRLSHADRAQLDRLRERFLAATALNVSRADMVRLVLRRGLAGIDAEQPILAQIPPEVLDVARPKRFGRKPVPSGESTRLRVLKEIEARPGEVVTPARVRAILGSGHLDTIRNVLLVLAERGRIDKLGPGQYQARRGAA
jgi:hypothetical protein